MTALVEVYHQNFWPLEWTVAHRPDNTCYLKLVCLTTQKVGHRIKWYYCIVMN